MDAIKVRQPVAEVTTIGLLLWWEREGKVTHLNQEITRLASR